MQEKVSVGQYDVDSDCRLYVADGQRVLSKVFGTGIAYPQRRCDGIVLPKRDLVHKVTFYKYPKVDSFDLYRNYVGGQIVRNLQ